MPTFHFLVSRKKQSEDCVPHYVQLKFAFSIIHNISITRVISVTTKEKSKPRPGALNTVEMLRVASSSLGIGPQQTMQIAERLYIQVCNRLFFVIA